jgi:endonuclease YncB( thermonuclease family)
MAVAIFAGASAASSGPAGAGETIAGPVTAAAVRVIDGDSIEVRARLWLDLELTVVVRLQGIDTPEIRGKCAHEKDLARAAKARLIELATGELVLTNIRGDKYFGRVDADVSNAEGIDLGSAMIASELARPYDGGARGEWCDLASLGG